MVPASLMHSLVHLRLTAGSNVTSALDARQLHLILGQNKKFPDFM